jgi:hypothetical protein
VAAKRLYRIRFHNEGRLFELYARQVTQGTLFGFVEIADLVWGSRSEVIIDPSEQELRNELANATRVHVPIHAIVRIDEVEKAGSGKIIALPPRDSAERSVPIYTPRPGPSKPKA